MFENYSIPLTETIPQMKDDFDNAVNYQWKQENPIPEEYPRYSNFTKLFMDLEEKKMEICNDSTNTFINTIYNLYKNQNRELILDHIKNECETILYKDSKEALFSYLLSQINNGQYRVFHICFSGTERNPKFQIPNISFGGLSLTDRTYYLEKTEHKDEFLNMVQKQMELLGYKKNMKYIWEIEKTIAESHYSRAEKREPLKTYHPTTLVALIEKCSPYLDSLKYILPDKIHDITVNNFSLLETFKNVWDNTSLEDLQYWYMWKTVGNYVCYLDNENPLFMNHFNFFSKTLNGIEKPKTMDKRAANFTENYLDDEFSRIYMEKYCDPILQSEFPIFVNKIRESLLCKIEKAQWITEDNRKTTIDKLQSMTLKVVSPTIFKDYSSLMERNYNTIIDFVQAYYKWDWEVLEVKNKMYQLRDPDAWEMSAMTVNAYYHPLYNEIVFPAGILQAPYYDTKQSYGENAGGIGAVIAHEMTHGFDDQGSNYDKDGYLYQWWSDETKQNYEQIIQKMEDYFNSLTHTDMSMNGKLTQGENLADLGGLQTAISSCETDSEKRECILSWARIWRANVRREYAQKMIDLDPHSPPHLRINGILPHIQAFYECFDIQVGDGMYLEPEKRCMLWSE